MDKTLFFLLFPRFRNHFFFSPIFGNAIATIAKRKFYSPISAMALPQLGCHKFLFELIITNHMWFIVKILWTTLFFFFYSSIDFRTTFFFFFFPIFGNAIATIAKKKFYSPILVSTLPKFNIFSLHFSYSLSYFWLNFGNGNTEIQSLSSEFQISFNSSYNAN